MRAVAMTVAACGPSQKDTELEAAVRHGDVAEVHRLLDEGADPNGYTEGGYTALMHAAARENVEVARALLDAGGDPDLSTSTGTPILAVVAYGSGNVDVAELLVAYGADACVDAGPLYQEGLAGVNSLRDLAVYAHNTDFAEWVDVVQTDCR